MYWPIGEDLPGGQDMTYRKSFLCAAALFAAVASTAVAQQRPAPPAGPFKALHLMTMTSAQEATYLAWVKDANQVFSKLGCSNCAYHLYKVGAAGGGKYNHMMWSDWPGRDVYAKLHTSDEYKAVEKKYAILAEVDKTQFYDRFVEIKKAESGAGARPGGPPQSIGRAEPIGDRRSPS
jgi:hypothetical protein